MTVDRIKIFWNFFWVPAALIIVIVIVIVSQPKQTSHENQVIKYNPPIKITTLFFAGDIMLSRNVAGKIYKANDFTLPFLNVKEKIAAADISFANLESPFNNSGSHSIEGSLVFNADPKSVEGLKLAGFDILSTANNHSLDQSVKGLDFTIDLLNSNGIIPTGTSKSNGEVVSPVIEKNRILYGFLAYSYTAYNDGGKSRHQQIADFNDLEGLKQDILGLKGHNADIVIVSMHAGTEYQRKPNQAQIDFAHTAIDAGADLVIGHHPHWIQTIEFYKDKPIFYSLGNLVFDQMWSQETKEGLTVFVTFRGRPSEQGAPSSKGEISKIELKPVIIEDYCCPRWANDEESLKILTKINLTSPVLIDKN